MSNTRLKYAIDPHSVYYTRDTRNPSIAMLTVSASNITEEDIHIDGFEVKIPVNKNINAENALVASTDSITSTSLSKDWSFSGDSGIYRATPIQPSTVINAGQSLSFYLKNIIVNNAEGTALIEITEKSDDDFATYTQEIVKTKSDLEIKLFNANPTDISSGEASTLSWTTNAARVTLSPGNFPDIKNTDSVVVHPMLTTTYTLTAFGEGPAISEQKTVQIAPPKIFFEVSKKVVDAGDTVSLKWEVTNAKYVTISYYPDEKFELKGSTDVKIYKGTDFTLHAITNENSGDSYQRTITVKINPLKIVSFTNKTEHGPLVLAWEMQSAAQATIEKSSGKSSLKGDGHPTLKASYYNIPRQELKKGFYLVTENVQKQVTYILRASNENGGDIKEVEIAANPGWKNFLPLNFPHRTWVATDAIVLYTFNNKMWSVEPYAKRAACSADGLHWQEIKPNLPKLSPLFLGIGTVYKNKMWLIGGTAEGKTQVWNSDDGENWALQCDDTGFAMRYDYKCFVIPGIDKMFIAGSSFQKTESAIWNSTDGKKWTKQAKPFLEPDTQMNMAVVGNKAYALCWKFETAPRLHTVIKVLTSADGENWAPLELKGAKINDGFYAVCALGNAIYVLERLAGENSNFYSIDAGGNTVELSKFICPRAYYYDFIAFNNSVWCMHGLLGSFNEHPNEVDKNIHFFTP